MNLPIACYLPLDTEDDVASPALSDRLDIGDIFVAVAVEIDVGFH